jgi:flagellar basal-body rod modification protein FlgD
MLQTSLTPSSGAAAASGAGSAASAMSDMFTRLLVAQIQNQDPTAPTDPSTYVNQLATLSQTQSMQAMTAATNSNASILQSLQVLALGAQVGSTVTATSSSVVLDTTKVDGGFTLADATTKTDLVLTGGDGRKHTIALGAKNPGDVAFSIDPVALGLAPGNYSIAVATSSTEAPAVQISGTLSSVKLSASGSVALIVANLGAISPSAVTGFAGPSPTKHD